ncbi:MAG: LuxR family transcriptional regulator [Pseudorhodobacter sp.]|nr:MAG: LuxR family transcriptional regulator [Pseudorhodobacter sp.]
MKNLGGSQRDTFGDSGDLVRSLRESCGANCLMFGFIDATTRELIEYRLAATDDCAEELRRNLMRVAATRVSILASLQSPQVVNGHGTEHGAATESLPVWTADGPVLLGIGKPMAGYYPVIALHREGEVAAETRAFLRFALGYVAKALTEYVYSKSVWPDGLAETTLKLLSISYFVINRNAEIEIDGRDDDQADCDFLTVSHNRLSTPDAKERAALAEAIRLATGDERQTAIVSLSTKREQLKMILVAPFERAGSGRALILFESRNGDQFALREHFFRAHAITRSEALVAHEVLNGKSAAEVADATGLSVETVRSYLKQVLCKTGTHRQTELIALYYGWTLPVGKSIATAELRRRH